MVAFADERILEEGLEFVKENANRPFFLYWSLVIPHANNERNRELKDGTEVPDFGAYADKDWKKQDKGQAAMVSLMDEYVGRMLQSRPVANR